MMMKVSALMAWPLWLSQTIILTYYVKRRLTKEVTVEKLLKQKH